MSNLPSDIKKIGDAVPNDIKKIIIASPLDIKGGFWRDLGSPAAISNVWSVDLDGSNEILTLDDHADFDFDWNDAFSISGWVKTSDAGWRGWIKKEVTSSTNGTFIGWSLGQYNGQVFSIRANHWGGGNAAAAYTSGFTIHDGNWHHVLFTYDTSGTNDGTTCYVDGVDKTLSTWASRSTVADLSILNDEPLTIGHFPINGYTAAYWDGPITEVSIWDKELSSGEVADIYNGGTPNNLKAHSASENLLGWWRFGDGPDDNSDSSDSAARIYDQSGNGHDLTPTNTEAADITEDTP